MNDADLCSIRQLARMNRVFISAHALQRFIERNISLEDAHGILKSENNCLIERQAPSTTVGKEHKDPRYLVYDKTVNPEIIVVCAISFNGPNQLPDINIVTAERVDNCKWNRQYDKDPPLIRK